MVTKLAKINWNNEYLRVYNNPNKMEISTDFSRRVRLTEWGYLEKTEDGIYKKTKKKLDIPTKKCRVKNKLKSITDEQEFKKFLKKNFNFLKGSYLVSNILVEKLKEFSYDVSIFERKGI